MRRFRWAAFVAIAGAIGGCDGGAVVDAGMDDAGRVDGGRDEDAGMDDGGMDDGGMDDGGMDDGGMTDGGMDGGPNCGNGALDEGEMCDGTLFGAMSCETILGAGATGALTCTSGCVINSGMCRLCGNGTIEGGEDCDGENLGGATCASIPGGFTSGDLACDACMFDTTDCAAGAIPSAAGQIVISEIMANPSGSDAEREWFEVHNPGSAPLNLRGCLFSDDADFEPDMLMIVANVVVPAGGFATFAIIGDMPDAPGFTPDYRFTGAEFVLNNTVDEIILTCAGVEIDRVEYASATHPIADGRSTTLSPTTLTATGNDTAGNWCLGATPFGTLPDRGTPDAANDTCPLPLDACRLQFPATLTAMADAVSADIFGRVRIPGVTEVTAGIDAFAPLRAQVGVGPDGSDPATATGWTWSDATANTSYSSGSPGHEMAYDEYQGTFTAPPAAGPYDYAFRFSTDYGATWTFCDTGAGSTDGYAAADAGQLTVTAPAPIVVAISPATTEIATSGTGILQVMLDRLAPPGGTLVLLESSTAAVVVPEMVTVPAGASSAGFRVRGAASTGTAIITATDGTGIATAMVSVVATATAPAAGDLALNEVLWDPSADANCSGTTNDASDEFVELVNVSTRPLLMTGVSVWDVAAFGGTTANFSFPEFTLGPGEAVLVFSAPTSHGAPGSVTTAPWCAGATTGTPFRIGGTPGFSGSALAFNNGGDTVRVTATTSNTSTVLDSLTWPNRGSGFDQSSTRSPDGTGTFTDFTLAPGRATDRVFSPGTLVNGRPFAEASAP